MDHSEISIHEPAKMQLESQCLELRLINAQINLIDKIKAANRDLMEFTKVRMDFYEGEPEQGYLQGKWAGLKAAQNILGMKRVELVSQGKTIDS